MATHPLISVVIPCFNQAQWLPEAIDSLLAQTYEPVQIIAVDDGSTDDTPRVLDAYADRVRRVHQANAGLPAARNAGIAVADGELLLFLDSDDSLPPDSLERLAEAALAAPEVDVVHGHTRIVDLAGQPIGEMRAQDLGDDPFHALLRGNRHPVHSHLVRRRAIDRVGGFDAALRSVEDWDFWLRVALTGGRFKAVDVVCANYRRHETSMSANWRRMYEAGQRVLAKHADAHERCPDCRRALWWGRRNLRYNVFAGLLGPQILRARHDAGLAAAAARAFEGVRFDPRALGVWLIEAPLVRLLGAPRR